jgi:hypothetical protein
MVNSCTLMVSSDNLTRAGNTQTVDDYTLTSTGGTQR